MQDASPNSVAILWIPFGLSKQSKSRTRKSRKTRDQPCLFVCSGPIKARWKRGGRKLLSIYYYCLYRNRKGAQARARPVRRQPWAVPSEHAWERRRAKRTRPAHGCRQILCRSPSPHVFPSPNHAHKSRYATLPCPCPSCSRRRASPYIYHAPRTTVGRGSSHLAHHLLVSARTSQC
jgi:hypothetical protein